MHTYTLKINLSIFLSTQPTVSWLDQVVQNTLQTKEQDSAQNISCKINAQPYIS